MANGAAGAVNFGLDADPPAERPDEQVEFGKLEGYDNGPEQEVVVGAEFVLPGGVPD